MRRIVLVLFTTVFIFVNAATSAVAADSVSVPGQITVDQCPAGYQHSIGISVNVTTHEYTTICNAPPSAADNLLAQQDQDFRQRIDAAQSAAQSESAAWNAANPGQQKCVQWGPVVHANGVSTASGGVCANPVALPDGISTPVEPTDPLLGNQVLREPVVPAPSNSPTSVRVAGQVSAESCPVGYKAANGIEVNATTGEVSTVCWADNAWKAWQLGGATWNQFVSSGGAVDVNLEIERRAAVAALKAQAAQVAQAAADSTPGIKRCTAWSGYGETGEECAYSFVNPVAQSEVPVPVDAPVVSAGEQLFSNITALTVAVKSSNIAPAVKTSLNKFVTKLQKSSWQKGKRSIVLPTPEVGKVSYKSANSKVCQIKGSTVTKRSNGKCEIFAVLTLNPWTQFSTVKQYVLR